MILFSTLTEYFGFLLKKVLGNVMEGLNYLPYKKKIVDLLSGNAFEGLELDGEICGISMMRAGESMEKALRDCSKAAVLGKMLIQKEDNGQFRIFYAKLPLDIHERFCFVLEPVLKTSQNVSLAIKVLFELIKIVSVG